MPEDEAAESPPTPVDETQDMLPARGMTSPPTIHRVNRGPFGLGPVPLLGGVIGIVLVLAIVLLALGSWLAGIVLLAVCLMLVALLIVGVEQEPEDPAARLARTAADRTRSRTRLVGVAIRAWSRAGLALLRFRQRRYRLHWRLRRQLGPLGEAAYRGDEARVEVLKARAKLVEQELNQAERDSSAAVGAARTEIERQRATGQDTQTLTAQRPESG